MGVKMDKIDRKILAVLEQDGRQPYGTVAEAVGISKTPCWMRVQKLQQSGVIRGCRADIDPARLGLRVSAFCSVRVAFDQHSDFEESVRRHPAILECYTTAGDGDYLLQVVTANVETLDDLLRSQISRLPGVLRTATTVCMKRIKSGGSLTTAAEQLDQGVE